MTEKIDILQKEHSQLYAELTENFSERQFKLLNELLETEIELEKMCNQ